MSAILYFMLPEDDGQMADELRHYAVAGAGDT